MGRIGSGLFDRCLIGRKKFFHKLRVLFGKITNHDKRCLRIAAGDSGRLGVTAFTDQKSGGKFGGTVHIVDGDIFIRDHPVLGQQIAQDNIRGQPSAESVDLLPFECPPVTGLLLADNIENSPDNTAAIANLNPLVIELDRKVGGDNGKFRLAGASPSIISAIEIAGTPVGMITRTFSVFSSAAVADNGRAARAARSIGIRIFFIVSPPDSVLFQ